MTLASETRKALATELIRGSSESRFLLMGQREKLVNETLVSPSAIGRLSPNPESASAVLWRATDWLPGNSLWIAAVAWLTGVMLFSLRAIFGLIQISRLGSNGTTNLGKAEQLIVDGALRRFPVGQRVRIAASGQVNVPTVVGILQHIVLIPLSALTELTPKQLELIVIHELAHIRRNDPLLNLIQTVIESLLFFHPCIWWISSIVRNERENCCDDAAVNCGDAASYTRALLKIEEARCAPKLAVAANGGSLLVRVRRLSGLPHRCHESPSLTWVSGIVCLTILSALLLSPLGQITNAQESGDSFQKRSVTEDFAMTALGKVINREMDKLQQVGFSGCVLVAHEGEIILARSEGFEDSAKRNRIRPDTLFEIASVTKSFTATAAIILAQQGKLDLGASIADYLPAVPDESKKITVLDLLRHQSGISATNYGDTSKDLDTAVKTMLAGGPKHEPGTKFEYWNQGYILLSEIIARAAGKPYPEFVREAIFQPCGMTGTCFTGDDAPKGFRDSTGVSANGRPRSCLEHPYGKMQLVYQGTGGIVSNVTDMWKFHKSLQGNELLEEPFKKRMHEKGVAQYACGWYATSATNGDVKFSHSGKVRGFHCQFVRFPTSDSCIVILANNDAAPSPMVAKVIEGILLPVKKKGNPIDATMEKKVAGEYKDSKGRILVVFASGEKEIPTQYMIYWDPKNPSAPISRGSVLQDDEGNLIFYQPAESDSVVLALSSDKSKVDSITLSNIDVTFKRFDIKQWSKSQRKQDK